MEEFPELAPEGTGADRESGQSPTPPHNEALLSLHRLSLMSRIRTTSSVVNAFKVDRQSERVVVFTDRVIPLRFTSDTNGNYTVSQKLFGLSPEASKLVQVGDVLTSLNGQPVLGVRPEEVASSLSTLPRPVKVGFCSVVAAAAMEAQASDTKSLNVHVHGTTESVMKSPSKQTLRVKFIRRPLGISITRSFNRWATAEVESVNEKLLKAQFQKSGHTPPALPRKGDVILAIDNTDVSQLDIQEIAAIIGRAFLPFVIKFKRPSNLATVELRDSFPVMAEYVVTASAVDWRPCMQGLCFLNFIWVMVISRNVREPTFAVVCMACPVPGRYFDLKKQSGPLVARRRFYFVVDHDRFEYYKDEKHYRDVANREANVIKRCVSQEVHEKTTARCTLAFSLKLNDSNDTLQPRFVPWANANACLSALPALPGCLPVLLPHCLTVSLTSW